MMEEILSIKDAATYLKVPQAQVYCLVRSGSLGAFKIGKHWRIPKTEMIAWVERQKKLFAC